MSDAYTIEVQSMTIGLVVRERDLFRFFSANPAFVELDGLVFKNSGGGRERGRASPQTARSQWRPPPQARMRLHRHPHRLPFLSFKKNTGW